jgi:hypothetical protein
MDAIVINGIWETPDAPTGKGAQNQQTDCGYVKWWLVQLRPTKGSIWEVGKGERNRNRKMKTNFRWRKVIVKACSHWKINPGFILKKALKVLERLFWTGSPRLLVVRWGWLTNYVLKREAIIEKLGNHVPQDSQLFSCHFVSGRGKFLIVETSSVNIVLCVVEIWPRYQTYSEHNGVLSPDTLWLFLANALKRCSVFKRDLS